jgi:hypothetical protein
VGWRDWRGFDRLDALDRRVGFKTERTPEDQTATIWKIRRVALPLVFLFGLLDLATSHWVAALITLATVPLWIRLPGAVERRARKRQAP